jgi:hypothetical protein
VFEIHGLILALHYEARFLKTSQSLTYTAKGFENILKRYGASKTLLNNPSTSLFETQKD